MKRVKIFYHFLRKRSSGILSTHWSSVVSKFDINIATIFWRKKLKIEVVFNKNAYKKYLQVMDLRKRQVIYWKRKTSEGTAILFTTKVSTIECFSHKLL